jgi:hypothetical protein
MTIDPVPGKQAACSALTLPASTIWGKWGSEIRTKFVGGNGDRFPVES